jgi:hypothetical protein
MIKRMLPAIALLLSTQVFAQSHNHSEQMSTQPTQVGQSAFAAIQEIVAILEKDPKTDWSKVNIEGLRQHLIDMDNVTLRSDVTSTAVPNGIKYSVSGTGETVQSIKRMIKAHAVTMDGINDWHFTADETPNGANLTVAVPAADQKKLNGLGFIGVMTRGMHHQQHHLALASGVNPHH